MLLIYNLELNHHAPPKLATCTKVKKKEIPTPQMGENIISESTKEIVVRNLNNTQITPQSPP